MKGFADMLLQKVWQKSVVNIRLELVFCNCRWCDMRIFIVVRLSVLHYCRVQGLLLSVTKYVCSFIRVVWALSNFRTRSRITVVTKPLMITIWAHEVMHSKKNPSYNYKNLNYVPTFSTCNFMQYAKQIWWHIAENYWIVRFPSRSVSKAI